MEEERSGDSVTSTATIRMGRWLSPAEGMLLQEPPQRPSPPRERPLLGPSARQGGADVRLHAAWPGSPLAPSPWQRVLSL